MSRPKILLVHWRDAAHGLGEVGRDEVGLVDLYEAGFLFKEDELSLTLVMEHQEGADTSRLWLSIPKQNIVEIRDITPKARKTARSRTARSGNRADPVEPEGSAHRPD